MKGDEDQSDQLCSQVVSWLCSVMHTCTHVNLQYTKSTSEDMNVLFFSFVAVVTVVLLVVEVVVAAVVVVVALVSDFVVAISQRMTCKRG